MPVAKSPSTAYADEFNPTVAPDRERWAMAGSFESLAERLCGRPLTGYRVPSAS